MNTYIYVYIYIFCTCTYLCPHVMYLQIENVVYVYLKAYLLH